MKVQVGLPEGSSTKLIRNAENSLDVVDLDEEQLTFQVRIGWKTVLFLSMWMFNLLLNFFGVFNFPS